MYEFKLSIVMLAVVASTLLIAHQMSPNPKTNKKTTTNPIKYLHQYLADWDFLSAHPFTYVCEPPLGRNYFSGTELKKYCN